MTHASNSLKSYDLLSQQKFQKLRTVQVQYQLFISISQHKLSLQESKTKSFSIIRVKSHWKRRKLLRARKDTSPLRWGIQIWILTCLRHLRATAVNRSWLKVRIFPPRRLPRDLKRKKFSSNRCLRSLNVAVRALFLLLKKRKSYRMNKNYSWRKMWEDSIREHQKVCLKLSKTISLQTRMVTWILSLRNYLMKFP